MEVITGRVTEARLGGAGLKLRHGHNTVEDMFYIQIHDVPSQEAFRAYLTKDEFKSYIDQATFTYYQTEHDKKNANKN